MDPRAAVLLIERLRKFRVRPGADASIGVAVEGEARSARRAHRADSGVAAAWAAGVPAKLAAVTRIERISRGVVTVRVPHDAARYELDRWLRAGGLNTLARMSPVAIRRVKVVV